MKKRYQFNLSKKLLVGLLLLSALASCSKNENLPPLNMGLEYFPLVAKRVVTYTVDSTVYNDFNNSTTNFQFQIKDSVSNSYTDGEGNTAYRIERFKKEGIADWIFQKTISKKIANNRAEEFVDNYKYIRLVFPTTLHRQWNGNAYNNIGLWQHEITEINEPLVIGTNTLDSTLTVNQYTEINLIREDIYKEIYAKNVGLVLKEVRAIDKDISTGRIKRGFTYSMQLKSYK